MKKFLVRYVLGGLLVLVFLAHALGRLDIHFVNIVDAYLYDARVRLSMPGKVDERIVIVDIDERSLAEEGRWPWNRSKVAQMVRQLTDHYKVSIVGFDVVFAEPDSTSGLPVLEDLANKQLKGNREYVATLDSLRGELDYDQRFAKTLKERPVVLGYYFNNDQGSRYGQLPPPVLSRGDVSGLPYSPFESFLGYGANLPQFSASALQAHFNPIVDFDGVVRRVPLLVEFDGGYYEALSLAMVRLLQGGGTVLPGYPDGKPANGIEWLNVIGKGEPLRVPVDDRVAALVPYIGEEKSFVYVSAVDVLRGKVPAEKLAGRIILVGTTAPGLKDLRSTPVGANYPGVEIHANMIAGILDGTIKQKPAYVLSIDLLMLLFFGGLMVLLLPLLSPLRATLAALAAVGTILLINFALWSSASLVLPLASALLLTILLYALNMSWGYFVESRIKGQLTGLFGQYVPPELVDEMAKDPENYSMEGRNQELTILFSDVRGFTTISEGLDPKELTQLMNEYLGGQTEVIRRHRGTLDKYIGDAIMAFWGAPVGDPDHARHAVQAALELQRAVRLLDEPFKARGWPELHVGIGINTGVVTVGDMGSPVRQAYTVMGDAVNLASRIESLTKVYGVGLMVGELTRAALKDFVFRELDRVRVKGKDEPVAIFEPLGPETEVSQADLDELQLWKQALRLFRAQEWDNAEVQLINLQQRQPRQLYKLYLERIAYYREHPPGENWDGVTTFETK